MPAHAIEGRGIDVGVRDVRLPLAAPAHTRIHRIRLWDLPVRVFHWSLALAVTAAIVTGELGGAWMDLHGKAGLSIVGLVAFRLAWGFVGSAHARFLRFAPTPAKVKDYLRGTWRGVGHNPLGALSVFALLSLLAAQATLGLFSNDDIAFSGPLAQLLGDDAVGWLTGWHKRLANVLLALSGMHVAAIAFYVWVKKNNLVSPMITGWKDVQIGEQPRQAEEPVRQSGGWGAFIIALAIALAAVYLASGHWLRPAANHAPAVPLAQSSKKPAW